MLPKAKMQELHSCMGKVQSRDVTIPLFSGSGSGFAWSPKELELESSGSGSKLESAPLLELATDIVETSPESELSGSYLNIYPSNIRS